MTISHNFIQCSNFGHVSDVILINIKLYTYKCYLLCEHTDVKLSDKTVLRSSIVGFMPPLQMIYKHYFMTFQNIRKTAIKRRLVLNASKSKREIYKPLSIMG